MIHNVARLPLSAVVLLLTGSAAAEPLSGTERLDRALAALQAERPGVVDAYVVVAALDSDPVFSREAREAGHVLAARFDAVGRTLVLANDEGTAAADGPGSPQTLAVALARTAQIMNRDEDVLVLYTTSHGVPDGGLVYRDRRRSNMIITPARFSAGLRQLGFKNRLLMLQACFSGQFISALKDTRTIVFTAAAADRSSFGCAAGNDWTYFGDALINHAFRQPLPLDVQFRRASALIRAAEDKDNLLPSDPQISMGEKASSWLAPLEAREPRTGSNPMGTSVLGLAR